MVALGYGIGMIVLAFMLWGGNEPGTETRGSESAGSEAAASTPEQTTAADRRKLVESYGSLEIIDVHNHDAWKFEESLPVWERYRVDKVVLFGNVSDPSAMISDALSWKAYQKYPDRIYPFFSGFDIKLPSGLETVRTNLEMGYLGIGETYAASTNTPISNKLLWKGGASHVRESP
jgi:hypothetical protein